jgi:hypothetical protein
VVHAVHAQAHGPADLNLSHGTNQEGGIPGDTAGHGGNADEIQTLSKKLGAV